MTNNDLNNQICKEDAVLRQYTLTFYLGQDSSVSEPWTVGDHVNPQEAYRHRV